MTTPPYYKDQGPADHHGEHAQQPPAAGQPINHNSILQGGSLVADCGTAVRGPIFDPRWAQLWYPSLTKKPEASLIVPDFTISVCGSTC